MTRNINCNFFSPSDPCAVQSWFKTAFVMPYNAAVQSRFITVDFGNGRFAFIYSPVRRDKALGRVFACRFAKRNHLHGLKVVEDGELFGLFGIEDSHKSLFKCDMPFYEKGRVVQGLSLPDLVPLLNSIAARVRSPQRPAHGYLLPHRSPYVPYNTLPWVRPVARCSASNGSFFAP